MNKYYHIATLLFSLIFIIGCSDSSTEPENEGSNDFSAEIEEVFKVSVGNTYTYNVDTLNFSTNTFVNIGSRIMAVDSKIDEGEAENFICSELVDLLGSRSVSNSLIRFGSNSVEFSFDTTGAGVLVPDSLKSNISMNLSENLKIIEFPFAEGEPWIAYKGSVRFGNLDYNILSINGQFEGKEFVQIQGFDNSIETSKFKYTLSLNIPDLNNPFVSNINKYEVYLWLSPEYGIVKIEGSGLMIKSISGGNFNLADSNKVYRHTLFSAE